MAQTRFTYPHQYFQHPEFAKFVFEGMMDIADVKTAEYTFTINDKTETVLTEYYPVVYALRKCDGGNDRYAKETLNFLDNQATIIRHMDYIKASIKSYEEKLKENYSGLMKNFQDYELKTLYNDDYKDSEHEQVICKSNKCD